MTAMQPFITGEVGRLLLESPGGTVNVGRMLINTTSGDVPDGYFTVNSLQNPGLDLSNTADYQMVVRNLGSTTGNTAGIAFTVTNTVGNAGGAIVFERTGG